MLTGHSQTELGLNKYVAVSDIRDGVTTQPLPRFDATLQTRIPSSHTLVADTHTVVAGVQPDIADTCAIVFDIRHQYWGTRKELTIDTDRHAALRLRPSPLPPRLKPGLIMDPIPYIFI